MGVNVESFSPPLSASIRSPSSKAANPCLLPELLAVQQFIFWQLTMHYQHFALSWGPWYISFGDSAPFKRGWCALLLLLLLFVNPTETCGWRCVLWTYWNNVCFCVVMIEERRSILLFWTLGSGWWRLIWCWGQVGGVAEIGAAGNMRFELNVTVNCKAMFYWSL